MTGEQLIHRLSELTEERADIRVVNYSAQRSPRFSAHRQDGAVSFTGAGSDTASELVDALGALPVDGYGEVICEVLRETETRNEREPHVFEYERGEFTELQCDDVCPPQLRSATDDCLYHARPPVLRSQDFPELTDSWRENFELFGDLRLKLGSSTLGRCIDAVLAEHMRTMPLFMASVNATFPSAQTQRSDDDTASSELTAERASPDALDELLQSVSRADLRAALDAATLAGWLFEHAVNVWVELDGLRDPQPSEYSRLTDARLPAAHCFISLDQDNIGHPLQVELDDGQLIGVHGAFVHRHRPGLLTATPMLSLRSDIRRPYPTIGYGQGPLPESLHCARYTNCRNQTCTDVLGDELAGELSEQLDIAEEVCDAILATLLPKAPPPPPKRQQRARKNKRKNKR